MITILMPIYNGIEFIDESVQSVIGQTFTLWELLIGINGHEENSTTYHLAKKYQDDYPTQIKVFDFYWIKGKSNTLNALVKNAYYDYIALIDVDDMWHERKLELQHLYFPIYDVVGTKCVYFGEKDLVLDIPTGDITTYDFFKNNPIINSSVIIKKELAFWDSHFDATEDYFLWMSLKKKKKTFYNLSNVLVKHRIHLHSAFNTKDSYQHLLLQEIKTLFSE